jgi:hypothetical protein
MEKPFDIAGAVPRVYRFAVAVVLDEVPGSDKPRRNRAREEKVIGLFGVRALTCPYPSTILSWARMRLAVTMSSRIRAFRPRFAGRL